MSEFPFRDPDEIAELNTLDENTIRDFNNERIVDWARKVGSLSINDLYKGSLLTFEMIGINANRQLATELINVQEGTLRVLYDSAEEDNLLDKAINLGSCPYPVGVHGYGMRPFRNIIKPQLQVVLDPTGKNFEKPQDQLILPAYYGSVLLDWDAIIWD